MSDATKEFFALNHSYSGNRLTVLADLYHVTRGRLNPEKGPNLRRISVPADVAWAFR